MVKISQILMATDFSDCAKEALEEAVFLAERLKAKLALLYVFEPPSPYPPEPSLMEYPEVYRWLLDFKKEEKERLYAAAESVGKEGVRAAPLFKEGSAAAEIVQTAKEIGADLIVLGTHGREGMSHFVMGSVAERVVLNASCPVLVVRKKKEEGS